MFRVERVFEGSAEDQGFSFAGPKTEPGWLGGRSPATRVPACVAHCIPRSPTMQPNSHSLPHFPAHVTPGLGKARQDGGFRGVGWVGSGRLWMHDRVQSAALHERLQNPGVSVRPVCCRGVAGGAVWEAAGRALWEAAGRALWEAAGRALWEAAGRALWEAAGGVRGRSWDGSPGRPRPTRRLRPLRQPRAELP